MSLTRSKAGQMMGIAKSTYYRYSTGELSNKEKRDHTIRYFIEIIHADFPRYGYHRISKHPNRYLLCLPGSLIRHIFTQGDWLFLHLGWTAFSQKQ